MIDVVRVLIGGFENIVTYLRDSVTYASRESINERLQAGQAHSRRFSE
jgi:hypothetical protein